MGGVRDFLVPTIRGHIIRVSAVCDDFLYTRILSGNVFCCRARFAFFLGCVVFSRRDFLSRVTPSCRVVSSRLIFFSNRIFFRRASLHSEVP